MIPRQPTKKKKKKKTKTPRWIYSIPSSYSIRGRSISLLMVATYKLLWILFKELVKEYGYHGCFTTTTALVPSDHHHLHSFPCRSFVKDLARPVLGKSHQYFFLMILLTLHLLPQTNPIPNSNSSLRLSYANSIPISTHPQDSKIQSIIVICYANVLKLNLVLL